MKKHNAQNGFVRAIKRFSLYAFVVITFGSYALEHRVSASMPTTAAGIPNSAAISSTAATPAATATGAPTSIASSGYKDGTYTGSVVNVNWGDVQVQATIRNGKVTNVQFLQYPNERTTSARINSVAVPELEQEAIQAQSANVNIITGATLTSEGFQQSLQYALSQAQG